MGAKVHGVEADSWPWHQGAVEAEARAREAKIRTGPAVESWREERDDMWGPTITERREEKTEGYWVGLLLKWVSAEKGWGRKGKLSRKGKFLFCFSIFMFVWFISSLI